MYVLHDIYAYVLAFEMYYLASFGYLLLSGEKLNTGGLLGIASNQEPPEYELKLVFLCLLGFPVSMSKC